MNIPCDSFIVNASAILAYLEYEDKLDITNAIFQLRNKRSIVLESVDDLIRNRDGKIINYTFDIRKIEKKQIA